MVDARSGLLRGQVIGPSGPIAPGATVDSFYCAPPVLFPETFGVYDATSPPTVFVWLLPVMSAEAEFIARRGWPAFEKALGEMQHDQVLLELKRPTMNLPA